MIKLKRYNVRSVGQTSTCGKIISDCVNTKSTDRSKFYNWCRQRSGKSVWKDFCYLCYLFVCMLCYLCDFLGVLQIARLYKFGLLCYFVCYLVSLLLYLLVAIFVFAGAISKSADRVPVMRLWEISKNWRLEDFWRAVGSVPDKSIVDGSELWLLLNDNTMTLNGNNITLDDNNKTLTKRSLSIVV